jgi:hypothetical protein
MARHPSAFGIAQHGGPRQAPGLEHQVGFAACDFTNLGLSSLRP